MLLAGDDLVLSASGVVVTRDRPGPQAHVWLLGLTPSIADFARLPPPFQVKPEPGQVSALYWNELRLLELRTAPHGRIQQIDTAHRAVRGEWRIWHGDTAERVLVGQALAASDAGYRGETFEPWPCQRDRDAIVCLSPEAPSLRYLFRAAPTVAAADMSALAAAAPGLRLSSLRWTPPTLDAKTLANIAAVQRVAARQIFKPVAPGTKVEVPLQGTIVEYVGAVAHTNQVGGVTAIRPNPCKKMASHSCVLVVGEACPANRPDCEGMYLRVAVDMSTAPPSLDVAYADFATVVATQAEVEAMLATAP